MFLAKQDRAGGMRSIVSFWKVSGNRFKGFCEKQTRSGTSSREDLHVRGDPR